MCSSAGGIFLLFFIIWFYLAVGALFRVLVFLEEMPLLCFGNMCSLCAVSRRSVEIKHKQRREHTVKLTEALPSTALPLTVCGQEVEKGAFS